MNKMVLIAAALVLFQEVGTSQILVNMRRSFLKKPQLMELNTEAQDLIHAHVHRRLFSMRVTCSIDYGQRRRCFQRKSKIRDADGRKIKFNSEVGILTYIAGNGWEHLGWDSFAFVFKRTRENVRPGPRAGIF